MDINAVLEYLYKAYPDIKELIERANNKFKYYTGFIKTEDIGHVTDTIIQHERHPAIVSGIKTLTKYPYFKFVWKTRDDEDDAIISQQYDSITDVFNVVYNQVVYFLPCVLLGSKTKPYKVIYDDKHNLFVVDLITYKGVIIDKYVTWNRKVNPLDRAECIIDTKTIKFVVNGVALTVEEYMATKYFTDFYKLLGIYRGELIS